MRFVVAKRLGRRGEGLGNEMLPWAKGILASHVLDGTLVGPSWGVNRRRYWRNFKTSRLDFIGEDILRSLPHFHFTQQDYYATGEFDFGSALRSWAQKTGLLNRRHFIVVVDGMYGGYRSIWNARPFLLSKLLASRDALQNVYRTASELDRQKLFVAVHMRLGGDFIIPGPQEDVRGKFNIRVPLNWYLAVCQSLRNEFGDRVEFRFFTDRKGPEYAEAVARFSPQQKDGRGLTECSDLLLMAQADLRVCSVSSYSLMSCLLAAGPYVWYEPQLHCEDGLYSLWGQEERQREPGSPTRSSAEFMKRAGIEADEMRGYPAPLDGSLSAGLIQQLHGTLSRKDPRSDLLEYGCVPTSINQRSL